MPSTSRYKRDPLKALNRKPMSPRGKEVVGAERILSNADLRVLNASYHPLTVQPQPMLATEIRRLILARLSEVVERQITIALDPEVSDRDATTAARFLADYSLGKAKRVNLSNEEFASVVVTAAQTVLPPDMLDLLRDAVRNALQGMAGAERD